MLLVSLAQSQRRVREPWVRSTEAELARAANDSAIWVCYNANLKVLSLTI
jgi:hypothetical protein